MEERLQARLTELRGEYAKGEQTLADLEAKIANVRATMLRISGAIQVLEELAGAVGENDGEREVSVRNRPEAVAIPVTAD